MQYYTYTMSKKKDIAALHQKIKYLTDLIALYRSEDTKVVSFDEFKQMKADLEKAYVELKDTNDQE